MDREDELQEQYEDSLFALLMNSVAISEGRKLLEENEQLLQDPDAAIPASTMQRCQKTINKAFAKRNSRTARHVVWAVTKNIAVAAMAVVLMGSVAFAAFPSFRTATLNLLIEVFDDDRTSFRFASPDSEDFEPILLLTVNWLPDGYTLDDQSYNTSQTRYKYNDSDGNYILIRKVTSDQSTYYIDTEDAITEQVKVQEIVSTLVQRDNTYSLIIPGENGEFFVIISSNGISPDDILTIAARLEF